MSLSVTIAGNALPLEQSAVKDLKHSIAMVFDLDPEIKALLATPLGQVKASAGISTVTYKSPQATWTPGPVQFGLQGGVTGTLQIANTGALVSYTDGLEAPEAKSLTVPSNEAFLVLTLGFNICGSVAGTWSGGAYGVTAELDTADKYAITFCKRFDPATTVGTAIGKVFEGFVLPFHENTLATMNDGDYLLHEFDGNLHLAFGAYAGLDKVLYAGQANVDVAKALHSSLASTVSVAAVPSITAGANLTFSFAYATRFEALLSKTKGVAHMHLFRSASRTTAVTLKAALRFDGGGGTPTVAISAQGVGKCLVDAVAGAGSTDGALMGKVAGAAEGEVQKYATEVNDKLTSWLAKANGHQVNLEAAIEATQSRTVLASYDFDLGSPQMAPAWKAAIAGDLVAAMKTGAVTLDAGSGLEREYRKKSSFRCNLFDLWRFSTWSQYASNVSMVYAGNNVFHVRAQVGRTVETDTMGARHAINLYFAATASTTEGQVSDPAVELHVDLTAQSDPKATHALATMLRLMGLGTPGEAMARDMEAFATRAKQGTAQVQVTIPHAAYAQIQCDPYSNKTPQTPSTAHDAVNWKAFAQAVDDLHAWPLLEMSTVSPQALTFLKSFAGWEDLNKTTNGSDTVNRAHPGNTSRWPEDFPQVDQNDRTLIVYSMLAGQTFMNFCEAVHGLASATDTGAAGTTWEGLVAMISDAVKNDLNVDFLRPAALALIRLCGTPAALVNGPLGSAIPADHFAVSITL